MCCAGPINASWYNAMLQALRWALAKVMAKNGVLRASLCDRHSFRVALTGTRHDAMECEATAAATALCLRLRIRSASALCLRLPLPCVSASDAASKARLTIRDLSHMPHLRQRHSELQLQGPARPGQNGSGHGTSISCEWRLPLPCSPSCPVLNVTLQSVQ